MSLYNDASLVMIPSAYKDGKLYSIKPTDGSGDFTFSRGSNLAATRVDVNGLIEKGRENLLLRSNAFDNSYWNKSASSIITGQTDPNGGTNAFKIVENTANAYHRIYGAYTMVSGNVYVTSVTAKAAGRDYLTLSNNVASGTAIFDLTDGSIATQESNVISASTTSLGGGWYRCEMVAKGDKSGSYNVFIGANDDSTIGTYTGDGTSGVFIYQSQLELGLVATEYIETGASTAQAGILEDMPRLDYSGGASCPSLKLEPSRTNLVSHSEYFGAWNTRGTASVTDNQGLSPEGVLNAALLDFGSTTSGANRIDLIPSISAGTDYVFSVFVKNIDANRIAIRNYNSTKDAIANFDFSSASFTNTNINVIDTIVEPYDNDWYRIGIVVNSGVDTTADIRISPDTISGSDGEQIYVYGAQLEQGSYPTSYIPTYGASVTRNRDYFNPQILNLTSYEQGVFFVDFDRGVDSASARDASTDGIAYRYTNTFASGAAIEISSDVNGAVRVGLRSGSFFQLYTDNTLSRYKIAVKWFGTSLKIFVNGALEYNSSTKWDVTNDFRYIGYNADFRKSVNQISTFPTALTDSEAIALTTL